MFLSEETELFSAFANTSRYLELEAGESLSFENAKLYDIEKTGISPDIMTKISGMYLVGRDIEPGDYTLTIADEHTTCYYTVAPDTLTNAEKHFLNRTQNTAEITLHEGEFLEIRNCILKK